jgi:hypothetical protein
MGYQTPQVPKMKKLKPKKSVPNLQYDQLFDQPVQNPPGYNQIPKVKIKQIKGLQQY